MIEFWLIELPRGFSQNLQVLRDECNYRPILVMLRVSFDLVRSVRWQFVADLRAIRKVEKSVKLAFKLQEI